MLCTLQSDKDKSENCGFPQSALYDITVIEVHLNASVSNIQYTSNDLYYDPLYHHSC